MQIRRGENTRKINPTMSLSSSRRNFSLGRTESGSHWGEAPAPEHGPPQKGQAPPTKSFSRGGVREARSTAEGAEGSAMPLQQTAPPPDTPPALEQSPASAALPTGAAAIKRQFIGSTLRDGGWCPPALNTIQAVVRLAGGAPARPAASDAGPGAPAVVSSDSFPPQRAPGGTASGSALAAGGAPTTLQRVPSGAGMFADIQKQLLGGPVTPSRVPSRTGLTGHASGTMAGLTPGSSFRHQHGAGSSQKLGGTDLQRSVENDAATSRGADRQLPPLFAAGGAGSLGAHPAPPRAHGSQLQRPGPADDDWFPERQGQGGNGEEAASHTPPRAPLSRESAQGSFDPGAGAYEGAGGAHSLWGGAARGGAGSQGDSVGGRAAGAHLARRQAPASLSALIASENGGDANGPIRVAAPERQIREGGVGGVPATNSLGIGPFCDMPKSRSEAGEQGAPKPHGAGVKGVGRPFRASGAGSPANTGTSSLAGSQPDGFAHRCGFKTWGAQKQGRPPSLLSSSR